MPQLAPMNWVFLVFFFWINVFFMAIGLWWFKESIYSFLDKSINENSYFKKWKW